ncbi:MAG TPA: class I tRNA ligase family protein [Pirellulaceae bacterium]|nr:class I tRNA ligase family protein [Pirellulaceae bacterium]
MFQPVPNNPNFPQLEETVLAFWRERKIFDQSLAARAGAPRFVFYEGPPTANGMPHPGHTLRAIKDLFPRYKTMRGYLCERKAGWDTHGLPVEVEVCKELGIHAKEEIEAYGIEPFIHKCQASVWRYMKEWERLTERIGFWIHLDEAYVTYHQSYVESVWWSLKNLFDRGLLYQGHKIVWWWAQGGTALSSGEVGQGYREVADPSVYVKFPLVEGSEERGQRSEVRGQSADIVTRSVSEGTPPTSLLVWTTTPWTLPSNQFAAVHPELDYATVVDSETGERLIMAAALVETIAGKMKRELKVESTCKGKELLGRRYVPPFNYYHKSMGDQKAKTSNTPFVRKLRAQYFKDQGINEDPAAHLLDREEEFVAWRIVAAPFVTTDSGSGVVHLAPAFGEVDFIVLQLENGSFAIEDGPRLINAVAPDGKFTDEGPDYCRGRWVKDCDKDIMRDLKSRGLLYHQEQYVHDYPFCWRAEEDPLIQYPRKSWFIRTTAFKDQMLANNERINWLPDHIQHGRFGNFLETNVDWALSRERYWGTPLPIWVCEQTGQMEAVASYDELLKKPGVSGTEVWDAAKKANPSISDDLKVHKPYIDAVSYDSPFASGSRMKRVSEVIDCWYDSGAMPFAQWGYRGDDGPPEARQKFREQFPADFIAEGLDQTRGWFYSQLAISTMLFGQSPNAATPQSPIRNPQSEYPHPFKNCIVWGLMLGEWWESPDGKHVFLTEAEAKQKLGDKYAKRVGKLSKSKRNYREPQTIFDTYGADSLRWYLFANQPPWSSILYAERAIKDTIPEFILRLWNCYSFFVIYANIDGFDPAHPASGGRQPPDSSRSSGGGHQGADAPRSPRERSELDRWITSELNRTCAAVVERMDAYDNYEACKRINAFVDGLSNWYVRRSRDRFWAKMDSEHQADKLDAYWTLYECLITTCKLIAPFTPFIAETMYRNLASPSASGGRQPPDGAASPADQGADAPRSPIAESVHLCEFPTGDATVVDETLSARMQLLREIASLGLSARMANKLKVRQPLAKVEVILSATTHQKWLEEHDELLTDELNVKRIEYTTKADQYITYQVQPNFKKLGPRLGKLLPACKQALTTADGGKLLAEMTASGKVTLNLGGESIELDSEDIQVRLQAKPGWAAAQGAGCVVVLATELTPELIDEGKARDLVRIIQDRRKELNLQFTDRIEVGIVGASAELQRAIEANRESICSETLAVKLVFEALPGVEGIEVEIGDEKITLYLKKASV